MLSCPWVMELMCREATTPLCPPSCLLGRTGFRISNLKNHFQHPLSNNGIILHLRPEEAEYLTSSSMYSMDLEGKSVVLHLASYLSTNCQSNLACTTSLRPDHSFPPRIGHVYLHGRLHPLQDCNLFLPHTLAQSWTNAA